MTADTALIATVLFILWLMAIDRRRREPVSPALWLPTLWALILGSRPVSSWFNLGMAMESADDYLEGSPFDRLVFLSLLIGGCIVLRSRRASWQGLVLHNKTVFAYFIFFAFSVLWSDHPYTAGKRWIKDFGNVIMALVILSEVNPVEGLRTVLARCLYVLVPMSVLLIRYYPALGRGYDRFTFEPYNQGVTTFKNQLGMMVAICCLGLVWELLRAWKAAGRNRDWLAVTNYLALALMGGWLLYVAKSATSLVCTLLGSAALMLIRLPEIRRRLDRLHWYVLLGLPSLFLLSWMFDLTGMGFKLLGRDPSFTGRTDIWKLVLAEQNNPLLGAGFYSFWTGDRITKFWELYGVGMNQAHNGYLEVYLIGGIIGVVLLFRMLWLAGVKIRDGLMVNDDWGGIRLAFWLFAIVHNFTEASFSKVSLLWFVLLAIMLEYPPKLRPRAARSVANGNQPERQFPAVAGSVMGGVPVLRLRQAAACM